MSEPCGRHRMAAYTHDNDPRKVCPECLDRVEHDRAGLEPWGLRGSTLAGALGSKAEALQLLWHAKHDPYVRVALDQWFDGSAARPLILVLSEALRFAAEDRMRLVADLEKANELRGVPPVRLSDLMEGGGGD